MTTKIYGDYEVYALAGSGGFGSIIVVTNMYEIHNRKAYILKTLKGNFIPKMNIELLQREIDLLQLVAFIIIKMIIFKFTNKQCLN